MPFTNNLRIQHVQEYVELAKRGSFTAAAEHCHITQPALSRHIKEIEGEIGTRLFERDTRNVSLTPAGSAVLEEFSAILDHFQIAHERAALLSDGRTKALRIFSPYYWTEDFGEPLIEQLEAHHPECAVNVVSCQPIEGFLSMKNGEGDVLLSIDMGMVSDEISRMPIGNERVAIVLSANHRLANRDSLRLEDLADDQFVFLSDRINAGANFNTPTFDLLAEHGVRVEHPLYTQQIDTLGMTIKKTGYVSILPMGVRHMDRSYLRFIPLEEDILYPMYLMWRKDNENPALDLLLEAALMQVEACA